MQSSLSTAATVAVQFMGASTAPLDVAYPVGTAAKSPVAKSTADSPKAVVEGEHTLFTSAPWPSRCHGEAFGWVVQGTRKSDLNLWMMSSTCSCTLAKFKNGEKAVVKPGEATEIALEFETRENNGDRRRRGPRSAPTTPTYPQFGAPRARGWSSPP